MRTGRCAAMRTWRTSSAAEHRRLIHRYLEAAEYPDGRVELWADSTALPYTTDLGNRRYHLYYPSRRRPSPAFSLVLDALRMKPQRK